MSLVVERMECPLTEYLIALRVFEHSPLVVIDVGASGGVANVWRVFRDQWKAFGFEPLVKECERLKRESASSNVQYIAAFVTGPPEIGPDGRTRLPETRSMDWNYFRSSAVRAQKQQRIDYVRSYFNAGEEAEYTTERTTLDDFFRKHRGVVNFIKIDTDGVDFEVLRGAAELLTSPELLGVIVESQFQGELESDRANVFANIDRFLRARGFQLFDLSTWRYSRAALPSKFVYNIPAQTQRGPVTWGDALFFRDYGHPDYEKITGKTLDETNILKLAALFEIFDLDDCATELLIKFREPLTPRVNVEVLLDLLTPTVGGRKMTYREFDRYFEQNVCQFYPELPLAPGVYKAIEPRISLGKAIFSVSVILKQGQKMLRSLRVNQVIKKMTPTPIWEGMRRLKRTWNASFQNRGK